MDEKSQSWHLGDCSEDRTQTIWGEGGRRGGFISLDWMHIFSQHSRCKPSRCQWIPACFLANASTSAYERASPFFNQWKRKNNSCNKFPFLWLVYSKWLKGLWVSVELGQPYFIKRLGMCNPALPLLWVGGRKEKKKERETTNSEPWSRDLTQGGKKKAVQDRIYAHAAPTLSHSKNSPSLPAPSLFFLLNWAGLNTLRWLTTGPHGGWNQVIYS